MRNPKPRFKFTPRKRRSRVRVSAAAIAAGEALISSDEFKDWLKRYLWHREQYPCEPFEEPPPK
jgi:hypothetical protein